MVGVEASAVLLTGSYGVGKSSVAVEIADVLEKGRAPYAILDVDFLAWFDTARDDPARDDVWLANVAALRDNYLAVGVEYFVVAGFIRDAAELEHLKATLAMPVTVVRLMAPWQEIERRLRADPTSGRVDDLREAATRPHAEAGVGLEDVTVSNDRRLREVAMEILGELGWPT